MKKEGEKSNLPACKALLSPYNTTLPGHDKLGPLAPPMTKNKKKNISNSCKFLLFVLSCPNSEGLIEARLDVVLDISICRVVCSKYTSDQPSQCCDQCTQCTIGGRLKRAVRIMDIYLGGYKSMPRESLS